MKNVFGKIYFINEYCNITNLSFFLKYDYLLEYYDLVSLYTRL